MVETKHAFFIASLVEKWQPLQCPLSTGRGLPGGVVTSGRLGNGGFLPQEVGGRAATGAAWGCLQGFFMPWGAAC